uniref:Uncharacterized protein n=1 Tax=Oryza glumipatula TaxID=40148 RepID=A0A0D9YS90_9ORYZ
MDELLSEQRTLFKFSARDFPEPYNENGFSGVSSLPSLREVMLKGDHNEELMKNLRDQIALNQNEPILKGA